MEPIFNSAEVQKWGQTSKAVDLEIHITKVAVHPQKGIAHDLGKFRTQVIGWDLRRLRIQAVVRLVVQTPLFTEYALPYLLFALPVLIALGKGVKRLL